MKNNIKKYLFIIFIINAQIINAQLDSFITDKKGISLSTGVTIKYLEYGSEHTKTIVLIHGYTDTSRSFQKVMQHIQKLQPNFRIICPDLRGHGNSSIPRNTEDFKIEDFSKDILALLDEKEISKFHLVGHSLGGMIAQTIAINHPEKLESLVLISTFSDATNNIAIQDFLKKELVFGEWKNKLIAEYGINWKRKSYHLTPKHFGKETLDFLNDNWVVEAIADKKLLNLIYKETINTEFSTWFETLKSIAEFNLSIQMEQLKVPTLVIWGSDDDTMPNQDQQKLKSLLNKAHKNHQTPVFFKTYSKNISDDLKIGHNLHWAFPREIALDIVGFATDNLNASTLKTEVIKLD